MKRLLALLAIGSVLPLAPDARAADQATSDEAKAMAIISNEVIAIKEAGWVDFKWQNPITKRIDMRTEYGVRVGEYPVGVGAYSQ